MWEQLTYKYYKGLYFRKVINKSQCGVIGSIPGVLNGRDDPHAGPREGQVQLLVLAVFFFFWLLILFFELSSWGDGCVVRVHN